MDGGLYVCLCRILFYRCFLCGLYVALVSGENQASLLIPEYARHALAVGSLQW